MSEIIFDDDFKKILNVRDICEATEHVKIIMFYAEYEFSPTPTLPTTNNDEIFNKLNQNTLIRTSPCYIYARVQ